MNRRVIYPGTFDPITLGHMDLINRASLLFDEVIIAVAASTRKSTLFDLKERVALVKSVIAIENVQVCSFEGLLIDFATQIKADVILRGLRAVSDFEFEFQLAGMNKKMASSIETLFMVPNEPFVFLSASMVREIAELGGNIDCFVHPLVKQALLDKFNREK